MWGSWGRWLLACWLCFQVKFPGVLHRKEERRGYLGTMNDLWLHSSFQQWFRGAYGSFSQGGGGVYSGLMGEFSFLQGDIVSSSGLCPVWCEPWRSRGHFAAGRGASPQTKLTKWRWQRKKRARTHMLDEDPEPWDEIHPVASLLGDPLLCQITHFLFFRPQWVGFFCL